MKPMEIVIDETKSRTQTDQRRKRTSKLNFRGIANDDSTFSV